jgi:hypothetical protein
MPHMVIFRDAEGRPGYHHADRLEDAVSFVEQLRNEQQVSDTRVFSMQEVPLEFKSYWRVEISAPATTLAAVPDAPTDADPVAAEPEVADGEPAPEPVASGRFGLFNRG